jgi:hypothetical protein
MTGHAGGMTAKPNLTATPDNNLGQATRRREEKQKS